MRPKSLGKLKETLKPKVRRNDGRSLEAIIEEVNRTLRGWFAYFKHSHISELETVDRLIRDRLRTILRKLRGGKGRSRGDDHHRWPNHYFAGLGLICLLEARELEILSLRYGANH